MADYYGLFTQYINVFAIIWSGIKTGLLSFIVALIVLVLFKKWVLVRRRYPALRYLAISYYFLIPLVCFGFGLVYGLITTSRDQIIDKLPLYQSTAQSFAEQNFDFNLKIDVYGNKSLDEAMNDAVNDIEYIILSEIELAKQNHQVVYQFILTVIESPVGLKLIKSNLKDKVASCVGLNRQLMDEVFEIKLSQLFTGDTIIKIMGFYVTQIANGFLIPLVIIWLILMLLPVIEIIFACRYNKKYQAFIRQTDKFSQ